MTTTQKLSTNSLDDLVAPDIAYFTNNDICSALGVSISTLARYRDDLLDLKIPRFKWNFYHPCDRDSVEILYQYMQLVQMLRKDVTREIIKQHMEAYWHGKKNR